MNTKLFSLLNWIGAVALTSTGLATTLRAASSDSPPTVHLLATAPSAAEEGSAPATFMVFRIGPTNAPLPVSYAVGGSAVNGEDYQWLSGEVAIPAGSYSALVTVTPIDDFLVEGWENIVLALDQPPVWPPAYIVSWPSVGVAYIEDNDPAPTNQPPQVAIVNPPDGSVFVAPVDILLVARASDPDGRVVSVEFFDGDVSLGVVPNPFWPPILRPEPILDANAPLDATLDPTVYPEMDAQPFPTPNSLFRLPWSRPAPGPHVLTAVALDNLGATTRSAPIQIRILEVHPQPVVTVRAEDPEAAEPDPVGPAVNTATFRICRNGPTDSPLTVWYQLGGTAFNGADYRELPTSAVIPRDQSFVDVIVEPLDDPLVEGDESVVLTIVPPICIAVYPPPPDCYLVGRPNAAKAVIHDNDVPPNRPPVVALVRPSDGSVFLAPADIRIVAEAFDYDGRVVAVEFFEGPNSLGVVTNGAPSPSNTRPPFFLVWSNVPPGHYILTAEATDDGGATSRSRPVEIKVVPPSVPPVVNIVATDSIASEPGILTVIDTATFEVSRTGSTEHSLLVFLSIGGTALNGVDYRLVPDRILIPAGAASAQLIVDPLHDLLVEGPETVAIKLIEPPLLASSTRPMDYYTIGPNREAVVVIRDNDLPSENLPPKVAIVRPENGDVFREPADILIYAAAFDPDGWVRSVEFFADGRSLGVVSNNLAGVGGSGTANDTSRPEQIFRFLWPDVPAGGYGLTAKATDNRGATTVSEPVRIRVLGQMPPVVTIEAIDPYAAEGPMPIVDATGQVAFLDPPASNGDRLDPATFVVKRSGGTNVDLTVYYRLSGTAANGFDYEKLAGQVVIPRGSWAARIAILPIDDKLAEGTETVVATLEPLACIAIFPPPPDCYTVGDPARAAAWIFDNDVNLSPRVEIIQPQDGAVFRAPADIQINVATVDPDGWVSKVQFFADATLIGEQEIYFIVPPPPGQPQTFSMIWSNAPLGAHVLTARATDNRGGVAVSDPIHVTVVALSDIPVVTIRAIQGVTWEQDPRLMMPLRPAIFEVTRRGGGLTQPLRVFYRISGTAANGVDYDKLSGDVTLLANEVERAHLRDGHRRQPGRAHGDSDSDPGAAPLRDHHHTPASRMLHCGRTVSRRGLYPGQRLTAGQRAAQGGLALSGRWRGLSCAGAPPFGGCGRGCGRLGRIGRVLRQRRQPGDRDESSLDRRTGAPARPGRRRPLGTARHARADPAAFRVELAGRARRQLCPHCGCHG